MAMFLSEDWISQAKELRDELKTERVQVTHMVRANMVITQVPFGSGSVDAHLDTSGGGVDLGLGHLKSADFTVTIDYPTARLILVDQDPQAGMQAFTTGRLKVRGDMTKLMALQQVGLPAMPSGDLQQRLQAITD
jgi:hypothetical protein